MTLGFIPAIHSRQHRNHGQHLTGDATFGSGDDMRAGGHGHHRTREHDDRFSRKARFGCPDPPGRPERHGYGKGGLHERGHSLTVGGAREHGVGRSYGGIATSVTLPGHLPHLWIWTGREYLHAEPKGKRELAPGHVVSYVGHAAPGGLRDRWHVTPANPNVVHAPPVPKRGMPSHALPAPSVHVAGHWGWSPVLKKHVWIQNHDVLSVDPRQLPPQLRAPVMQAIKSSAGHTHAHTAWGVSGHRVWVIPGHWHFDKKARTWKYIERHVDAAGRPHDIAHAPAHAPSAAFGPRPAYVPPASFWPVKGQFRNARNQRPSDAPASVPMPPHAVYADKQGLLGGNTHDNARLIAMGAQRVRDAQRNFAAAIAGQTKHGIVGSVFGL